ncbi:MAG: hypothetical protein WD572_01085 [Gammaproteobacteria bacterium]
MIIEDQYDTVSQSGQPRDLMHEFMRKSPLQTAAKCHFTNGTHKYSLILNI